MEGAGITTPKINSILLSVVVLEETQDCSLLQVAYITMKELLWEAIYEIHCEH